MSTEILISSDPWENRVAILEDGALAELYIEREEKVIGSIYKGKVQNVLPGMGAAFVDIGLGRNAFLYVDDISKQPLNIGDVEITQGAKGFTIAEKAKRGDDVLVQIVKEPRGLKGARISTNVSLPGRYLILMPNGRFSGVSRKIESATERDRLKSVMKRIRPEGMATVVRTAAAGVSEAELIADLGVLIRMWHGILETFKRAASPALLHKDMNLVYKAARDFITADVDKVLIDNEDEYGKVRAFLQLLGPQYLDRVEYYDRGRALFDDYKITDELQKLMRAKVNLPSGGSIVIESTEALTVIDVNSGKFTGGKNLEDTIVKTNIEAATEIARQVRLRDIGGIIVVDFIDMSTETSRSKVIKTLEDGLRKDRTRSTIQSFSSLGLLEFTRKRIGKDLGAQLRGACPTCSGSGSVLSPQSVAIDTLRGLRAAGEGKDPLIVHAAPTVAAQLEFWYESETEELSRELECSIHVRVDDRLNPERTRFDRVPNFKDDANNLVRVGDEHTVDLLPGRLPNATSAAAALNGHVVEVENAANNAGNSARIRVLDVDDADDYVLAEMIEVGAKAETGKRKRRRGGRKAPLTAAQQTAELRELAKEAEEQSARVPLGITTVTEEEEATDKVRVAEAKAERSADAIVIAAGEVHRREDGAPGEEGEHRRRRRRRGGRGRKRHNGDAAAAGIPDQSARVQVEVADNRVADNRIEEDDAAQPVGGPLAGSEDGEHRRRRRRRRGRGRGSAGQQADQTQQSEAVPDRHIFRVGSNGNAEATGETAPREPSRAIATLRRAHPPAVDAPAPSLKAPKPEIKATKPVRRRPAAEKIERGGELEASPIRALPPASKLVRARPKAAAKKPAEKAPAAVKAPVAKKAPAARKKATAAAPKTRKKAASPAKASTRKKKS